MWIAILITISSSVIHVEKLSGPVSMNECFEIVDKKRKELEPLINYRPVCVRVK
jgi:hypothetical protein